MADTNTPTPSKNTTKELGASGTLIQNGLISGEEYNRKLIGKAALAVYDEMRRSDAHIRGALKLIKQPILSASWDVRPAKDADGNIADTDQEAADLVKRELLEKLRWKKILKEILTSQDFGHSVFEYTLCITDYEGMTRVGIESVAYRKQTTIYAWQMPDGKPGITQLLLGGQNMATGQATNQIGIPRQKLLIFTNDQEGNNYEGVSLLRYLYKDWSMKSSLTLVNAVGLEKQSVGVPVVSAKDGQTPSATDEANAESAVKNVRANEKAFLKLPASMTVEMLDMKGQSTKDVLPTLAYHKRAIYEAILATFMDLGGSSGSGSQSLSGDMTSLFMKAETELAEGIAEVINDELVKPLCDMNYTNLENGYPRLVVSNIGDDDIEVLSKAASELARFGLLTPDPELENHIRQTMRLPELPKEIAEDYDSRVLPGQPQQVVTPTTPPADKAGSDTNKTAIDDVEEQQTPDQKKNAALSAARQAKRKLIEVEFLD